MYLLEGSLLLCFVLSSSDVRHESAPPVASAGHHDRKWPTCIALYDLLKDHGFSKTCLTDLCML